MHLYYYFFLDPEHGSFSRLNLSLSLLQTTKQRTHSNSRRSHIQQQARKTHHALILYCMCYHNNKQGAISRKKQQTTSKIRATTVAAQRVDQRGAMRVVFTENCINLQHETPATS